MNIGKTLPPLPPVHPHPLTSPCLIFPISALLQCLLVVGSCKQREVTIFSRILRHPDFGPALMSLVVEGGFDSRSWGEEPAVGELGGLLALARSALLPRDPSCVFPAPKGRCRARFFTIFEFFLSMRLTIWTMKRTSVEHFLQNNYCLRVYFCDCLTWEAGRDDKGVGYVK